MSISSLKPLLETLSIRDARRCLRQAQSLLKQPDSQRQAGWAQLLCRIETAARQREHRWQQRPPALNYPEHLPVVQARDTLLAALDRHQVVIIAGETGSGKTTQLPKLCLELGRGQRGLIGHTQPRRLAARSVASRLASELQVPLGKQVGVQIRFSDQSDEDTLIKLMTDGILLAEIQTDPYLNRYDTLIIDEAHERSLNIDFLLGYLRQLLPKRPDLKLIITSATLDPERFARFFNGAPLLEVSGRSFPVEQRYRPLTESQLESDEPMAQAVLGAIEELVAEAPGDILVFLSTEREIREVADFLRRHAGPCQLNEILPLYSRLSIAEQGRIFQPSVGRRVVLATNVAETSLTVPGIKYVIDTGLARISRYSFRSRVQRLPIEPISQAAARQRAGRCGRTEPGVCIRLYDEADFNSRPAFTEPEILRTNLASVILQMQSLRLGELDDFPLPDAPDSRAIQAGRRLLVELGALADSRLTPIGRKLAQLAVDPRLGRMLLAASELGALKELLIIVAALSVQDPRERPPGREQAADELHRRFADDQSDFSGWLKLWEHLHSLKARLSHSEFRRQCQKELLSFTRLREWLEVHAQLKSQAEALQLRPNSEPAAYDALHQALLTGLLTQIGLKQSEGDYLGVQNRRFHLFPGSSVFKKRPAAVVCAELVETSRVYGRMVARIEPEWLERLAQHLLKRSHSEPHYEAKRGEVVAFEQLSLQGLILVDKRKVQFGSIDPVTSRQLFIRAALVERDYGGRLPGVLQANYRLIDELAELEEKGRRRDLLVDDQHLFEFYDRHLPASICQRQSLEAWLKQQPEAAKALQLTEQDLLRQSTALVTEQQFPDHLELQGIRYPLSYRFSPGDLDDGVSLTLPVTAIEQVQRHEFDALVPGLWQEKLTALIKTLPKALRRNFVPAPEFAKAALEALVARGWRGPALLQDLATELKRMSGVTIERDDWDLAALEPHLRMNFKILTTEGKFLTQGRELASLLAELAATPASRQTPASTLKVWPGFPDEGWPWLVSRRQAGVEVLSFQALAGEPGAVRLQWFADESQALASQKAVLVRLLGLGLESRIKTLKRQLPLKAMALHGFWLGNAELLLSEMVHGWIADRLTPQQLLTPNAYQQQLQQLDVTLVAAVTALSQQLQPILDLASQIRREMTRLQRPAWQDSLADIEADWLGLVQPGFISTTPLVRLHDYPRYLKGLKLRLERLVQNPAKDAQGLRELADWPQKLSQAQSKLAAADWQEARWLVQEYRLALFSPGIKTAVPVSAKRLEKLLG